MDTPIVILNAIKNQFESPITKAVVYHFCSGRLPESWDTPEQVLAFVIGYTPQQPTPTRVQDAPEAPPIRPNVPEEPLFYFTGTRREYETAWQKVGRITDYVYRIPVFADDIEHGTIYEDLRDTKLEYVTDYLHDGDSEDGWTTDSYGDTENYETVDIEEEETGNSETAYDDAWDELFPDDDDD